MRGGDVGGGAAGGGGDGRGGGNTCSGQSQLKVRSIHNAWWLDVRESQVLTSGFCHYGGKERCDPSDVVICERRLHEILVPIVVLAAASWP